MMSLSTRLIIPLLLLPFAALAQDSPAKPRAAPSEDAAVAMKEDPARSEEIADLLIKAKKRVSVEALQTMSARNKQKVMAYYRQAKAVTTDNRVLARGLSGVINGYSDIEGILAYLDGDQSGPLPLPYTQFKTALESNPFPGADRLLQKEIDLSRQLEDKLIAMFKKETAETERRTAEIKLRTAETEREIEEIRKQTELIKKLLQAMK